MNKACLKQYSMVNENRFSKDDPAPGTGEQLPVSGLQDKTQKEDSFNVAV